MTDALILAPNAEALVSLFLRRQAEIAALLGGPDPDDVRVYTALPDGVEFPAVRIVQVDELLLLARPSWLYEHRLQLDAWGGSKADALRVMNTAQAAMSQRLVGIHDEVDPPGIVTGVRFEGRRDFPDATHAPARPRWLMDAIVTTHPLR